MIRIRTEWDSSVNVSTKMLNSSSVLSVLLAYSSRIQIRDALASGSSSSSKLTHRVGMTTMGICGIYPDLQISNSAEVLIETNTFMTTTASCTT